MTNAPTIDRRALQALRDRRMPPERMEAHLGTLLTGLERQIGRRGESMDVWRWCGDAVTTGYRLTERLRNKECEEIAAGYDRQLRRYEQVLDEDVRRALQLPRGYV